MGAATSTPEVSATGVRSGLRREPTQQRGHDTVERILDAATAVLVEAGLEGFNTNVIAERAEVNVATVYSYFVDKFAIFQQLVHRLEMTRKQLLGVWLGTLTGGESWATWFPGAIQELVRFRTEFPGGVEIFAAIKAIPELRETELTLERNLSTQFALAMQSTSPTLDPERAYALARVIVIAGASVLDRACRDGKPGTVNHSLVAAYTEVFTAAIAPMLDG